MKNEKRLIYVEDIYKYAINGLREGWLNCEDYDVIVQAVEESPTADAVEVVHGRWNRVKFFANATLHHCSICDHAEIKKYNYCPNCGAKMDEQ